MKLVNSDPKRLVRSGLWLLLLAIGLALMFGAGFYSASSRVARITEVMTADLMLDTIIQARHDTGIVELLAQGRNEEARELSLARYYTRVLIIADIADKSHNPALRSQAQQAVDVAKNYWKRHPFKFSKPEDNERLQRLLSH